MSPDVEISPRKIFGLAFPALGVLVAMPLYLLVDTAMVGRLGTQSLAALGAASVVQSVVTTQLTFLSYGTTARAARHFGANQRDKAVAEGVQATWVAVGIGGLLMLIMWAGAGTIAHALTGDDEVGRLAATWLRIAAPAIPITLIEMAGNGWMRGIQNTRKPLYFTLAGLIPGAIAVPIFVHLWGLEGSALATVLGMGIIAVLFLRELIRSHEGSWKPDFEVIRKQLLLGRDLIVRSMAFQIAMLSAAAVAGRFGASSLAGHQVLTQLWNFLTLILDSLAIAAQALIGAALGAGSAQQARRAGLKIMAYSTGFSVVLAIFCAFGSRFIPHIFTDSADVLNAISGPWWVLVAMVIGGGIVFALDGVLLGAGDAAFLRTLTIVSVLLGYLPGVWIALAADLGLTGVWVGLAAFIALRAVGVLYRFNSMKWAVNNPKVSS